MIDQDTGIVQVDAPVAIVHDVEVRVMEPEGETLDSGCVVVLTKEDSDD